MAPHLTPESQPNERPLQGICLGCGHGYTPRVAYATTCYACWRASRAGLRPVDERSQRRQRHHEHPDGTTTPAAHGPPPMPSLPRHDDGSTPAWRANLARAVTLRLRATRTADALEQRRLRACAYDLERAARIDHYDTQRRLRLADGLSPLSRLAVA